MKHPELELGVKLLYQRQKSDNAAIVAWLLPEVTEIVQWSG